MNFRLFSPHSLFNNRNRLSQFILLLILTTSSFLFAEEDKKELPPKELPPSHLMVGPGIFDVDQVHPRAMFQIEYRWDVNCYHLRPLVSFFITTDGALYACGGLGYDIFLGKKVVITPSFAPGVYYHAAGKNLGFPINFRSSLEVAYILKNKGRLGVQFFHISNARMLWRNPGADQLVFFYAIPFPNFAKKKSEKKDMNS